MGAIEGLKALFYGVYSVSIEGPFFMLSYMKEGREVMGRHRGEAFS